MYKVIATDDLYFPQFINDGDCLIIDENAEVLVGDLLYLQSEDKISINFHHDLMQLKEGVTAHVIVEVKRAPQNEEAREVKPKNIEWSKTVNTDDIEDINEKVKGATVLLDGLLFADDVGHNKYQKHAYTALNDILFKVIENMDELKGNIDYMQDLIRR